MPNRILRDWTDSDKIHALSVEAERFFTRLIMKADDYGRYISDVKLLRAFLFPLHGKMKEEKVHSWLKECIDSDLILCYEVNGKKYLEIKMFNQTLKIRRSKYPPSNEEDRLALREGYVYIIGTSYNNPVKIGFSVNPWSRLKEITANNHEQLEVLLTFKATKKTESLIHSALKNVRMKNEWFILNTDLVDVLLQYSKEEIEQDFMLELLRSNSIELRRLPETEIEKKPKLETETKQKVRDNVALKNSEIEKLNIDFLPEEVEWMFDKLSAYKLSKGKTYKSDYGAMLTWVIDSLKKEKNSAKKENEVQSTKFQKLNNDAQIGLDLLNQKRYGNPSL